MEILNTQELLKKIKEIPREGLEVWTKMGILSSTKAVYFHKGLVYVFQMEDDFIFSPQQGLTEQEFLSEYTNWNWKIEQIIG